MDKNKVLERISLFREKLHSLNWNGEISDDTYEDLSCQLSEIELAVQE
jgi:hypothetical protein